MPTASLLSSLQVFAGEINPAETRVYARLPLEAGDEGYRLTGAVVGPTCAYSHTLTATVPLLDRGREPALLAEAIVPDPCFWSPELPFLYQLRIELRRGSELLETVERPVGIKPLGTWKRRLLYAKKNLVLRAARFIAPGSHVVSACHDADLVLDVVDPHDDLLESATQLGAWVIARFHSQNIDELARVARWPAVAIAVLPPSTELDEAARFHARSLLLGQFMTVCNPIASWAQVGICPLEHAVVLAASIEMPLIVERRPGESLALKDARSHCDRLQRDLAGLGEFAGYLVGDVS